ncbi:MAG: extracellular solute-binding protein [Lachnospiraceae bacterium]|nr:extracellular solute-binding protein [Lachnospiraceae bacterium]MDD3614651.1 extracellular solute-binding protein [Lachnospiraceae bacterium]
MKFKKFSALLLATVMVAGTVAGCGSSSSDSSADSSSDAAAEESTDAAEEDAATEETADAGDASFDGVTITLLKDTDIVDDGINAVIEAANEKLGIEVEVEQRVGGADGDNIVKTRLASGDMADICLYNSGSLLQALNPSEYFQDLSNEEFVSKYDETYKSTVTVDGVTYGVPVSSSQAGAILYYKPDYEELGLEVPKTWDEFIANCDALQAAGKTAMIGTFGDSWTSQVMYLGDNYNVLSAEPDFAEKFEAGEAKYATTPAGVESFQKLSDVQKYYNEDYLAATYDDGCDMIANGEGTHWVILTQALSNIYSLYPEAMEDVGVFAIPGDNADDNGLTVWMPSSLYVNKNAENMDAVLAFMDFWVSDEGLDAYASAVLPDGPYCIQGYELPDNAYPAVKDDMQAYFDAGKTNVALEFLTAVKGSNCPAICQECGSGQTTAEEAAAAYDEDCKKQAVQLGLDWK